MKWGHGGDNMEKRQNCKQKSENLAGILAKKTKIHIVYEESIGNFVQYAVNANTVLRIITSVSELQS